jgi:beta-galactosidase
VGRENGSAVVPNICILETAGAPAAMVLHADRTRIVHDPNDNDAAFVTVTIVDAWVRVPTSSVPVTFSVGGAGGGGPAVGQLVAVGTGDPTDPSSFTGTTRTTWHGHALAVLRPLASASVGTITLTASAPGLKPSTIEVLTTAAVTTGQRVE